MAYKSNALFSRIFLFVLIANCSGQADFGLEDGIKRLQRVLVPGNSSDQIFMEQIKEFLESYATDGEHGDVSHAFPKLINDTLQSHKMKDGMAHFLQCYNDTMRMFGSVSLNLSSWSNQMLDAWGKVPPGIVFGDFNWVGSYQQCIRQEAPANKTAHQQAYKGKYCTGVLMPAKQENLGKTKDVSSFTSSGAVPGVQGLSIGLCLPSSCNGTDVSILIYLAIQGSHLPGITGYGYCQPTERREITTRAAGVIAMLAVITLFLVLGTLYDIVFYRRTLRKAVSLKEMAQNAETNGSVGDDVPILSAEEHKPLSQQELYNEVKSLLDKEQNCLGRILMCFSVLNNCHRLFTVAPSGSSNSTLEAVHGIRFLSMSWVILGHTFFFAQYVTKNIGIAGDLIKRFTFQAIVGATVSVDSFFVLSGLLVTFLALREMKRKGGALEFNWVLFYVHRYWRLTIPYMIILGLNAALFEYMGSGPLWPAADVNVNCNVSWWTNLLYVNNLVHTDKSCFGWAWYLANDMQFYWVTPLFLVPFFWKWWAGLLVSLATLLTSLIVTGVISAHYDFPAGMPGQILHPEQMTKGNFFNLIYQAPWCRIGPYIVGVMFGYILYKTDRQIKINKFLSLLGWCLAATINMLVVYGLFDYTKGKVELNTATAAFYNAVHRSAWGLGLCWVIFACVTGHGGPVNKILSWSAIVPLSRLTYMAYLVHPIVMMAYYFQQKYLFNYDDFNIIYAFFGHMVMAYCVAFVACIMFEAPFMALEKVLIEYASKLVRRSRNV